MAGSGGHACSQNMVKVFMYSEIQDETGRWKYELQFEDSGFRDFNFHKGQGKRQVKGMEHSVIIARIDHKNKQAWNLESQKRFILSTWRSRHQSSVWTKLLRILIQQLPKAYHFIF